MKRPWLALGLTLVERLDTLAQRERMAVFAAAALAIVALVYVAGIEPALQRSKLLAARNADQQRLLATAQVQQRELAQSLAQDQDAELRAQIARKQRQLADIDTRLASLQRTLVSPERMLGVLRELMGREQGVQLVSLRNLPAKPLVGTPPLLSRNPGSDALPSAEQGPAAKQGPAAEQGGGSIYRHGVEIVVQGNYLALLAYVARLERQPWQVFWGKTVLSADYSTVVVSLTLYTLSLDKAWLTL